jgi:hypothetical protein
MEKGPYVTSSAVSEPLTHSERLENTRLKQKYRMNEIRSHFRPRVIPLEISRKWSVTYNLRCLFFKTDHQKIMESIK